MPGFLSIKNLAFNLSAGASMVQAPLQNHRGVVRGKDVIIVRNFVEIGLRTVSDLRYGDDKIYLRTMKLQNLCTGIDILFRPSNEYNHDCKRRTFCPSLQKSWKHGYPDIIML